MDVGGTSTDVSRFDGRYEVVYETTTAGISIQSPQLDINTVAAGGVRVFHSEMDYSWQVHRVRVRNQGLRVIGAFSF